MARCGALHDDLRRCRLTEGHDGEHVAAKPRGTTLRNVRVSDTLWEMAQEAAESQGETVSDVIRRALREYVKGNA